MKKKLRFRLFIYFVVSLAVFALLIGIVFTALFSKYTLDIHKQDLEAKAVKIAETLSSFFNKGPGHGGGYGAYLRFLDDIAMTNIWIVDPDLEQIVRGHGQAGIAFKDLPENTESILAEAMAGNTSFSESFSPLLDAPSVTVAAPIMLPNGDVAGVVLLHSQLADISKASSTGLWFLLISMFMAVLISFVIAGALASRFTRPLEKMKHIALQISGGDFTAKTDIKQNDEIGELAFAMDKMAAQLEDASQESEKIDQLRREFLANVSHELRTPVTVLRGSLEALCDEVVTDPDTVADYHRQMLTESIHLERLVADLLDLSLLQNVDFSMDIQTVDIRQIVDDAVRSMRKTTRLRHIEIDVISDDDGYTFQGDYGRLRQMLVIILDNAIKFSLDHAVIKVTLVRASGHISLSVSDTGRGIAPEDLPHIFDRFYRQRSEQNKAGTGLGLVIAKQIADRHHIEMTLQSEMNKGTVVTFVF